ncbi:MAG: 50S ribosome-binding GTPase, partial [Thermoguttaceae bacterium]|nr:50S ribosome-binding GTPase [Thermoguttaceae bacterium]
SHTPGSTRDYVTARVVWNGVPLEIVDTAGYEDVDAQTSSIAAQAQELANEQKDSADIVVLCVPVDQQPQTEDDVDLVVRTKSDKAAAVSDNPDGELFCSAVTGDGIEELRQAIVHLVVGRSSGQTEILASTSQRCRELAQRAEEFLTAALDLCRDESGFVPEELIAENLRLTLNALGEIVGDVCTDDILEGIFGRFCVGK